MINFEDMHEKVRKILEARVAEQDVGTQAGPTAAEKAKKQKEKEGGGAVIVQAGPTAAERSKAQKDKERGITDSKKLFKKKIKELSNDQIERDQEEDEKDEIDTKTRASAKSGQAVEGTRPHKPQSGDAVSRSRSTGRGPITPAERAADKAAGEKATAQVKARSAEIAAEKAKKNGDGDVSVNASKKKVKEQGKGIIDTILGLGDDELEREVGDDGEKKKKKKDDDDVDEWGSGEAVAQKDKRQDQKAKKASAMADIKADEKDQDDFEAGPFDSEGNPTNYPKKKVNASKKKKVKESFYKRASSLIEQDSETKKQIDKGARGDKDTEDWAKKLSSPQKDAENPIDRVKKLNASKKKKNEGHGDEGESGEDDEAPGVKSKEGAPKDKKPLRIKRSDPRVQTALTKIRASKKKAQEEAKKGDSDWIQKAVNPEHKGYCTPMTKSTCTPARKALAKRFKKAARKEKKSGGTGWQGKV